MKKTQRPFGSLVATATAPDRHRRSTTDERLHAIPSRSRIPVHSLISASAGYRTFSYAPPLRREQAMRDRWQYATRVR